MNNVTRPRFLTNILAMYVAQAASYLPPLIAVPYLLRTLGPSQYGGIAFAESFLSYAVLFVDYSFGFTSTRETTIHRDDDAAISRIFWSTQAAKLFLLCASCFALALLMSFIPSIKARQATIIPTIPIVLASALSTQWYFLAREKLIAPSTIQAISKLFCLPMLFYFVRSTEDQALSALILSIPNLLSSIACAAVLPFVAPVKRMSSNTLDVLGSLTSGWSVFASNAATTLYVTGNTFLLGLISNNYAVAEYGVANKLALATFWVLAPITQVAYPRTVTRFNISDHEGYAFLRRLSLIIVPVSAIGSIVLFVFAPEIIRIVAGDALLTSVRTLKIFAPLPFMLSIGTVVQMAVLGKGEGRTLLPIYLRSGIFGVACVLSLGSRLGANGAAIALIATELVAILQIAAAVYRRAHQKVK